MPARDLTRFVTPRVALGIAMGAAFVLYAALAYGAYVPRFFLDELYYMEAAVSVAQGDGLRFHGEEWEFSPLFPIALSVLVRATPDQEVAYSLAKLANVALFVSAAIPVFLLARRLLAAWPSVAIATVTLAVPSAMYVSVVMTESLGFLLACWALYASAITLERPTVSRQLAAVALLTGAVLTRTQFLALVGAYVTALVAVIVVSPTQRALARGRPTVLWPTAAMIVAGVLWLALRAVRDGSAADALGAYSPLIRGYDLVAVLRMTAYHVGELALYLAVVPIAVAPIVVSRLWPSARAGDAGRAAFLALFTAATVTMLVVVGAFASTDERPGAPLFDRYLFYLVPLLLIVVAVWLGDGMPRPRWPTAIGAALALVTVATLPFAELAREDWFRQFQAVATEVWGKVGLVAEGVPLVSVRMLGVLFAVALVAAVAFLPRRFAWFFPAVVTVVLAANLALAWRSAYVDPAGFGSPERGARDWVDERLGTDAHAVAINVARECNAGPESFSGILTDFFNRSVDRAFRIGGEGPSLRIRDDGVLTDFDGAPVVADFAVVQPGVELDGRPLAEGMTSGLVLWEVGGELRVENARTEDELRAIPCPG